MNIIFNIVHLDGFLRISEHGSRSNSEICLKEWRMAKVTALFTPYFYVPCNAFVIFLHQRVL
jgi:hypothetical protein